MKKEKLKTEAEDMRSLALKRARHYLQLNGYNGFSFQNVADDLGIKKASLHYYFSSKEEMGLALLEEYQNNFVLWAEKNKNLSAKDKLDRMIDFFSKISENDYKICPIGALCADFTSLSKKLQKSVQEFHEKEKHWLFETLVQGQNEGLIRKNIDLRLAAQGIMAQVQGGLQIARLFNDSKSFKKLIRSAIALIQK